MPKGPSALRANVPARRAAEEAALNASWAFFWARAAASVLLLLAEDDDDEEARRRGVVVRSARTLRSSTVLRIFFIEGVIVRNGLSACCRRRCRRRSRWGWLTNISPVGPRLGSCRGFFSRTYLSPPLCLYYLPRRKKINLSLYS